MAVQGLLQGKVAVITGSSSGIGAGIAVMFAREGALVSLTGRNKDALDDVAKQCRQINGKDAVQTVGEISDESVMKGIVKNTLDAYGKIDILVNNAGVGANTSLLNFSLENYDNVMNVNCRAPFQLTSLCTPHLIKTQGNVVNISSALSFIPDGNKHAYCMSKVAIDMFTKCAAKELAPHQVRVNCVNPGVVETQFGARSYKLTKEGSSAMYDFTKHLSALQRNGTVEDIANAVTFLASSKASFITGDVILVDGGIAIHNNSTPQGQKK